MYIGKPILYTVYICNIRSQLQLNNEFFVAYYLPCFFVFFLSAEFVFRPFLGLNLHLVINHKAVNCLGFYEVISHSFVATDFPSSLQTCTSWEWPERKLWCCQRVPGSGCDENETLSIEGKKNWVTAYIFTEPFYYPHIRLSYLVYWKEETVSVTGGNLTGHVPTRFNWFWSWKCSFVCVSCIDRRDDSRLSFDQCQAPLIWWPKSAYHVSSSYWWFSFFNIYLSSEKLKF